MAVDFQVHHQAVKGADIKVRPTLDEYIRFYNSERPHHSLGMKTPAEAATMTGVSA